MPRGKYPPTPNTSTGPTAQEKLTEMESAFALPPAAINQRSPPTSPTLQRKRTLSGSVKNKDDLPPPPSRARKIIQMKPKEDAQTSPTASSQGQSSKSTSPNSKRKQPSATSAAGRKIARKTAHSIIERRRRSKMNEEFGVLKDMIPACKGVEMHKLAILQAGIEYVKYLQGCVDKLQGGKGLPMPMPSPARQSASLDADEESEDEDMEQQQEGEGKTPFASPRHVPEQSAYDYRRGSIATTASQSTNASPALRPNTSSSSLASQRQLPPLAAKTYSTSPPPLSATTPLQTGISPAFNAIHFNPDLRYANQLGEHSPNILPLPKAAMPLGMAMGVPMGMGVGMGPLPPPGQGEGQAEATATAALMMLTNDRRSAAGQRGGMSVRDLLSH